MFEFEIMLTGYSVAVVTTSVVISKWVIRKQLKRINQELALLKTMVSNDKAVIKSCKNQNPTEKIIS